MLDSQEVMVVLLIDVDNGVFLWILGNGIAVERARRHLS